jgi:hypothetical protein
MSFTRRGNRGFQRGLRLERCRYRRESLRGSSKQSTDDMIMVLEHVVVLVCSSKVAVDTLCEGHYQNRPEQPEAPSMCTSSSRPHFHLFPLSIFIGSSVECVLPPLSLLRLGQIQSVNSVNTDDNDTEITPRNRVVEIRDFLTEFEIRVVWFVANRPSWRWISE